MRAALRSESTSPAGRKPTLVVAGGKDAMTAPFSLASLAIAMGACCKFKSRAHDWLSDWDQRASRRGPRLLHALIKSSLEKARLANSAANFGGLSPSMTAVGSERPPRTQANRLIASGEQSNQAARNNGIASLPNSS